MASHSPIIPTQHLHWKITDDITSLNTIDQIHPPIITTVEKQIYI